MTRSGSGETWPPWTSASSPVLAITTRSSPATSSIPRASLAPPVPPASTTTGPLIARRKLASWTMGADVRIREVGPRDGFQNEPEVIATADKVRLIDALARTGLRGSRSRASSAPT